MKKLVFLALIGLPIFNVYAQTPFTTCPNANLAIVRPGANNPNNGEVKIYQIDNTGATSAPLGTILNPSNGSNLQVNGIGLNTGDGYMYGLSSASLNITTINNPLPFYRIGANAVAAQMGNIKLPDFSPAQNETTALINPGAGEFDRIGNYYFTGATGAVGGNLPLEPNFTVTRIFLGKLSGITGSSTSTLALLTPTYTQIQAGDANVVPFLNTLTATYDNSNLQDFANTGLNDLVYDMANNKLYSYVVYTAGGNTYGLMVMLDPSNGNLTSVNNTTAGSSPFVQSTVGVSGTLLDANGNFLILFTNGQIYKANTSAPGVFTGTISQLSNNTGPNPLPNPLRGDLASCGAAALLPIALDYFNAYNQSNTAVLKWETSSEVNAANFIVEKSSNAVSWAAIQIVTTSGANNTTTQYQYIDKDINSSVVYYRLKLVDVDGSYKYSIVKKVSFGSANNTLNSYPNPASNTVYIESNIAFSGDVKIQLNNMLGKTFSPAFKRLDNKLTLDISNLSSGVYFMQIVDGNTIRTQKIVKQ